jgi:Flp pilus assembly protein CpaB
MNKEPVMRKRSDLLLLVGVAAFLVGSGLVVSILRSGSDSEPAAASIERTVLVAREGLAAGTDLDEALAGRQVARRTVADDERSADAIVDPAGLRGRVLATDVAAGQQLRASQLRPATLRGAAIQIPAGKQGVALQLPFTAGGAGYVGAGDRVNVYGNVELPNDPSPTTKLVLADVEVLDVSTEVAPRVASGDERPAGGAVTYLLALDAHEAERVIFLAANAQIWLALAGDEGQPLTETSGRRAFDVLP